MAALVESYLIHGHVGAILTMSILVPILNNKLGNIYAASNYSSSLVLKIFVWVIIILYGERINLDELQFSYQQNCSTNMCTWMVVETIDEFVRII